ncbi:hypothetical protein ABZ468_53790 [Streptomyces sp. NPDC005708]|uniref:hypothetical protein n=1 Tax=Streptomyces sp. NPDC005708 TaxID=3154564 RepID=UPI0033CBA185
MSYLRDPTALPVLIIRCLAAHQARDLRGVLGFGHHSVAEYAVEGLTEVLREEVTPLGTKVFAVEPGAYCTRAWAGCGDEPVKETIDDYRPRLESVRAAFVDGNGRRPGVSCRGVRAAIATPAEDTPPHQPVIGSDGYGSVAEQLESLLAELRRNEYATRGADVPQGQ